MIIAKKICNYVNIAYVNACINSETRCIDADVETHAIKTVRQQSGLVRLY